MRDFGRRLLRGAELLKEILKIHVESYCHQGVAGGRQVHDGDPIFSKR